MDSVFVGWIWDRQTKDWLSVCTNADIETCHRELIRYADGEGIHTKYTALTDGDLPGWVVEWT